MSCKKNGNKKDLQQTAQNPAPQELKHSSLRACPTVATEEHEDVHTGPGVRRSMLTLGLAGFSPVFPRVHLCGRLKVGSWDLGGGWGFSKSPGDEVFEENRVSYKPGD